MLLTVAGIDPSLRNTGLAKGVYDTVSEKLQITSLFLAETDKQSGKQVRVNSDDLRRGSIVASAIHYWLQGCAVAFAEIPSGAQSANAAKALGIATGVLSTVGVIGPFKGRLVQVMPQEVKKLATGSKVADKNEMVDWAVRNWPDAGWLRKGKGNTGDLVKKNEHLADACAAIHAGIQTDEFKQLVQALSAIQAGQIGSQE